jgi:hypothetical protein
LLLGEDDAKPVSETRADWIEVLADTPAPDSRHAPAVGNLVCERIAAGSTLNQIASEPGMPSRSTINRWCTDRPEFKRQYDIAVQLRADGLLEETIEIIDDRRLSSERVLVRRYATGFQHAPSMTDDQPKARPALGL